MLQTSRQLASSFQKEPHRTRGPRQTSTCLPWRCSGGPAAARAPTCTGSEVGRGSSAALGGCMFPATDVRPKAATSHPRSACTPGPPQLHSPGQRADHAAHVAALQNFGHAHIADLGGAVPAAGIEHWESGGSAFRGGRTWSEAHSRQAFAQQLWRALAQHAGCGAATLWQLTE